MANIQERRNKEGKLISFSIRVHRGRDKFGKQLKPYTETFKVEPNWKEEYARKKAEAFAAVFEMKCKNGIESDCRQTFEEYSEYVLKLKEQRGVKHSTICRYKELTNRIYPQIGHIKLKDLRVSMLNELYTYLHTKSKNKHNGKCLSAKTVLEHHRLISTVLEQAVKEGIIPSNIAHKADPPKITPKEVNYFQPEQIREIQEASLNEPVKWRVMIHLLLITGVRRGELLGLKWENVDFENEKIYICKNILYAPDVGVYEDTPKTKTSNRYISLPTETMELLKAYRKWQEERIEYFMGYYQDKGYVFAKDDGNVMHPDSVTDYLSKFSKKYNLPHINAHAFRHTMASILYYNGADSVSISKRLGHAQVSTTANIYAHIIDEADKKNADILSSAFKTK